MPEQIVRLLRQIEVGMANGMTTGGSLAPSAFQGIILKIKDTTLELAHTHPDDLGLLREGQAAVGLVSIPKLDRFPNAIFVGPLLG